MDESLYFEDRMGTTLICPNQVRANRIKVGDVPRQFDPLSSHSIFDPKSKMRIPLMIEGVASGFVSRKTTLDESEEYEHIELTSPMTWEPSAGLLAEKESRVLLDACLWLKTSREADMRGMQHDRSVRSTRRPSKQTDSSSECGFQ